MTTTRSGAPDNAGAALQAGVRLYLPCGLQEGATATTSAGQNRYLGAVMRRGVGDRLRVFNGADGEFAATIMEVRRDACVLHIGANLRPQAPETDTWLVFALLKRNPTDLIVQKATELGVAAILPVFTTRTNADRTNVTRLRAIATEAAEQSERLSVPKVHEPRALNAVLAQWPAERRLVACLERGAEAPIAPLPGHPTGLLVGPEGGFTDAELDAVRSAPFVEAASLGPRILRAETASIVGLALLQAG